MIRLISPRHLGPYNLKDYYNRLYQLECDKYKNSDFDHKTPSPMKSCIHKMFEFICGGSENVHKQYRASMYLVKNYKTGMVKGLIRFEKK